MCSCKNNSFKVGVFNELSSCNCKNKSMNGAEKRVVMRFDNKAYPIPAVNIVNLSQVGKGTATNNQGKYSLNAQPTDKIQFSHIGFKTVVMLYRDIPEVLEMQEQVNELSEVVVTPGNKVEVKPSANGQIKKFGTWSLLTAGALLFLLIFKKDDKKNAKK